MVHVKEMDIDNNNLISVVTSDKVKTGEASLYTALDDNTVKEYKINILKVYRHNQNFYVYLGLKDYELLDIHYL